MYDSSGVPDSLSKRTGTFLKFDSCSSLLIAKGTYDVIDLILNTVKSFWFFFFGFFLTFFNDWLKLYVQKIRRVQAMLYMLNV